MQGFSELCHLCGAALVISPVCSRVPCSPHWPYTQNTAKDVLEILDPPASTSPVLELQLYVAIPRDQTQDLMNARQAFYQHPQCPS